MSEIAKIRKKSIEFLLQSRADALSFSVLDFDKLDFESFSLEKSGKEIIDTKVDIYFDLASLSKPLTNGIAYLAKEKQINHEMNLVLNHKGGLPAWGLLPRIGWQDIIKSFKIHDSDTLYSDYSALRFMLEFNDKFSSSVHKIASQYWDKELFFWTDLTSKHRCIQNGYFYQKANVASVHDPNAFNLKCEVSHAGLFATLNGVIKTLFNIEKKFNICSKMYDLLTKDHSRFVMGWDTVSNPKDTLAGLGASPYTFGHLGFTGTSIWIDAKAKKGYILLTNATKEYWYDKDELNKLRKSLGFYMW